MEGSGHLVDDLFVLGCSRAVVLHGAMSAVLGVDALLNSLASHYVHVGLNYSI